MAASQKKTEETASSASSRLVCTMEDLQISYNETATVVAPSLTDMTEDDVDALSDEAVLALLAQGEDGEVSAIVRDLSMIEGFLDTMEGTSNQLEGKLHELLREFQGLRESVAEVAGGDDSFGEAQEPGEHDQ